MKLRVCCEKAVPLCFQGPFLQLNVGSVEKETEPADYNPTSTRSEKACVSCEAAASCAASERLLRRRKAFYVKKGKTFSNQTLINALCFCIPQWPEEDSMMLFLRCSLLKLFSFFLSFFLYFIFNWFFSLSSRDLFPLRRQAQRVQTIPGVSTKW